VASSTLPTQWRAAEDVLGHRVLSNQLKLRLVAPIGGNGRSAVRPTPRTPGHAYNPAGPRLFSSGKYDSTNRPSDPARATNPSLCGKTSTGLQSD